MEKAIRQLELEKIKQKLRNLTHTVPGSEKALFLKPFMESDTVKLLQKETSEAAGILTQENITLEECPDMASSLNKLKRNGTLDIYELEKTGIFLKLLDKIKDIIHEEQVENFPRLMDYITRLPVFPSILKEFDKCLSYQGDLRDDASSKLFSLRREDKTLQEKIRRTMESFLHDPNNQKYLQDNIVTMRSDRYVLPVKREFQHKINGIVHDQSSSGQTLFIEPLSVLELNNRLREIRVGIEKEIERIMQMLSWLAGEQADEISRGYYICGELDFILARGRLSLAWGGVEPKINDEGYINIVQGRHPLLPPDEVVPIDVYIGRDFTTLVITGPNTGGKTVCLKTVGIFALMGMCGLHLTADEETELAVFHFIGTDIGDEQSIEQSLSTFSSHMRNIVEILQNAHSTALVLLDELGAGTDPSEGSVLAMAILEDLHGRGVRTVATTHINELKVFAHLREGMENASMEFNIKTLSPTYRLLIGIPGQSNALTVAERLGMPQRIIEKAHSFMDQESLDLEKAVSGLLEEKDKYSKDSQEVEKKKIEMESRLQELKNEQENLRLKRKEIMEKTREQANEVLRNTRQKANEIMKKIHQAERERGTKEALVQGEDARNELKSLEAEPVFTRVVNEEEPRPLRAEEVSEGDIVYVKSIRCQAKIVRIVDEEVQVQAGAMKINTTFDDLHASDYENEKIEERGRRKTFGSVDKNISWNKSISLQPHVDLRGLILDEALEKLEKYLDDALLAGFDKVEIIHGKGSGKLRSGVHNYLQSKGYVNKYRLGNENEGGSGVTIVELKKNV